MKKTLSRTAALAVVAALGLAGCGNGTKTEGPSPADKDKALKFAQCMRQHGVNLPDPGSGPVKVNPYDPKLQAARVACKALAPPTHREGKPSGAEQDHALKLAECLRRQGLDAKDPAPGTIDVDVRQRPQDTQQRLVAAYTACNRALGTPKPREG